MCVLKAEQGPQKAIAPYIYIGPPLSTTSHHVSIEGDIKCGQWWNQVGYLEKIVCLRFSLSFFFFSSLFFPCCWRGISQMNKNFGLGGMSRTNKKTQ